MWSWMGVRCFRAWVFGGESSVCGDRLVAWRIQSYENAGLGVCNFISICDVI